MGISGVSRACAGLAVRKRRGVRKRCGAGSIAYTPGVPDTTAHASPGVFITLVGPDGSGKSSLVLRLAAFLGEGDCDVVTTREPGSTPFGERVRRPFLGFNADEPARALARVADRAPSLAQALHWTAVAGR